MFNGLYVVDIYKDEFVESFGPLQAKAVISKDFLGELVRNTALNAYRVAYSVGSTSALSHPFTVRKHTLELVSERHGLNYGPYEIILNKIVS